MNVIIKKWNSIGLIGQIIVGLLIGTILGITIPQFSVIGILGDIFVGALKAIAPILVFTLVISSLAQNNGKIGKTFHTVIGLYVLSTFLASLVAVAISFLFPVTLNFTNEVISEVPSGIGEVMHGLLINIISNPVSALVEANYIGILAWSIVLGLALKELATENTKIILHDISDAVLKAVNWIISLAPFGILGLMFQSISTNGINVFIEYGRLILNLIVCMTIMALVVTPAVVAICLKTNPYPLVLKCLKKSGLTAFFTRSSAANIPVNMMLCKELGLNQNNYSVSIPLGATINMNGAAITITVMTLAAVHSFGINVDLPTAVILGFIATLGACGTSGVSGGSILLIPMACSLFGIGNDIAMQVVGIGFIIGVIQDSCETALNSSSDVVFAATAEYMEWKKEGRTVKF